MLTGASRGSGEASSSGTRAARAALAWAICAALMEIALYYQLSLVSLFIAIVSVSSAAVTLLVSIMGMVFVPLRNGSCP